MELIRRQGSTSLSQATAPARTICIGAPKGQVKVAPDFDTPLPDEVMAAFRGALMRVLLDTHVFLWAATDSRLLKAEARRQMLAADGIYVSAASIWETAIKARLGKIDPSQPARAIEDSGFIELPVRAPHAARIVQLPLHHNGR